VQRAQEKEAAIQKAATRQLQALSEQVEDLGNQLQARILEVDSLRHAGNQEKEVCVYVCLLRP
jgi:hypothetical protein